MGHVEWEDGWLDEVLLDAYKEVLRWPEWMQDLSLRYQMNTSVTENFSIGECDINTAIKEQKK